MSSVAWTWLPTRNIYAGGHEVTIAMMNTPLSPGHQGRPTETESSPTHVHPDMASEWRRLTSFVGFVFPAGVFVLPLAGDGFFLPLSERQKSISEARLECAFCGITVMANAFVGKNAHEVHLHFSPLCSFASGEDSSANIPVVQTTGTSANQVLERVIRPMSAETSATRTGMTGNAPDLIPSQAEAATTVIAAASSTTTTLPSAATFSTPQLPHQAIVTDDEALTPPHGTALQQGSSNNKASGVEGEVQILVTYEELGIFTQRPKRPDLAVFSVRVNTFNKNPWPHPQTLPPEEMAEAGFYFTGRQDFVRCFHCMKVLGMWISLLKPWVEHCRWSPHCPFVCLSKGQSFVDAVKNLNNPDTRPTSITEEQVIAEMQRMDEVERRLLPQTVHLLSDEPQAPPERDPTMGPLARTALKVDADITAASASEVAEQLEDENEEMRDSFRCKMCQVNEVNVLFLPCGHLVACALCSAALKRCAMCRQKVRGSVRVDMDDKRNQSRDGDSSSSQSGQTAT